MTARELASKLRQAANLLDEILTAPMMKGMTNGSGKLETLHKQVKPIVKVKRRSRKHWAATPAGRKRMSEISKRLHAARKAARKAAQEAKPEAVAPEAV